MKRHWLVWNIVVLLVLGVAGLTGRPVAVQAERLSQGGTTPLRAVTATPLVAVTATPVVAATTTMTPAPSATVEPSSGPPTPASTALAQPTQTVALTPTAVPTATPIPPTATPTKLPTATAVPPVVAPWVTVTPAGLFGPLLPTGGSPLLTAALIGVGGLLALLALVLAIEALLRQRRKRVGTGPAAETAPAEESLALTGGMLGERWTIKEKLGSGQMGTVYLAEDRVLGRPVAVKVVRASEVQRATIEGAGAGTTLYFEAKQTAALQHPNILVIHDVREAWQRIPGVGDDDALLYVVMEYLDGISLADIFTRLAGHPLPDDLLLRIVTGILSALEHAHAQGIIHRDLKPANIMLLPKAEIEEVLLSIEAAIKESSGTARETPAGLPDGGAEAQRREEIARRWAAESSRRENRRRAVAHLQVKVLDFGLSYRAHGEVALTMPQTLRVGAGTIVGTPNYVSPEQIKSGVPGEPADLYAVGVLLFQMLTGRLPFPGVSVREILMAHLNTTPPAISAFRPELRREVGELVQRLLAKAPQKRPQTAAEVLHEIEGWGETLSNLP